MAVPTTKEQFRDYILRRLGYPVSEVNVDDEQVTDRIDDALRIFRDYHYDGTERDFLKHTVLQSDIDNKYITLPDSIIGVVRVLALFTSDSASSLFSIKYHIALNELAYLSTASLIPYHMAMTRLMDLYELFAATPGIEFEQTSNRVKLHDWTGIPANSKLVFEVFRVVDPASYADVWQDPWMKDYATALVKKQWGENIKIMGGIVLLNNVTINGQAIYDEAMADIERLDSQLIKKYSRPLLPEIA
jgi:hypothetical protein